MRQSSSVDEEKLMMSCGKDYVASLENLNSIFNEIYTDCHGNEASMVTIDTMIVQVVDVVKSHLMFAVREEFDLLKEKIDDLEKKVADLEMENKILRQFVPSEIVAQIDNETETNEFIEHFSR